MCERGEMTVREAAKRGGESTAKRGPAYFSQLGKKGGAATKARYGRDHYERIGRQGGRVKKADDAAA